MSEERKKPGAGFWAIVALIVPLAYPVSFGPACWISSRAERGGEILAVIYKPILKLMSLKKLSEIRSRLDVPA